MYWKNQNLFDVFISIAICIILWISPKITGFEAFSANYADVSATARIWLAPTLAMLGMTCTATAFIFTVIEKEDFEVLRKSKSQPQLWKILSQIIFWLAASSICCAILTFIDLRDHGSKILYFCSFLIVVDSISILKFSWLMRQIVGVRIDRSSTGSND